MQALAFGSGHPGGTQLGALLVSGGNAPAPGAPVRKPGSTATVTAVPAVLASKFAVVLPVMPFKFSTVGENVVPDLLGWIETEAVFAATSTANE
jgi:hypothetical protein